jgi:2-amino-4-hydroxy-6-hydroxymethyldihydropteridine diphosphokinase
VGRREAHLAFAWARLGGRPSPLYETAAVGGPPQRSYLNGVISLEWSGTPRYLLELCQGVEQEAGRERRVRWGPRTLDLDVIALGSLRLYEKDLELPHPRALRRAFVLRPLLDLGPRGIPLSTGQVLVALRAVRDQPCRLAGPWPSSAL